MPAFQTPDTLLPEAKGNSFKPDTDAYIIPLQSIEISANSPRKDYDEDQMEELIRDVKQKGILEPILVQKAPSFSDRSQKFILISGHRRLRAALKLGLLTIPARVTNFHTEEEKLATQLCENIQRKDGDSDHHSGV
jgi:ParB family chromosome partitioning protein